MLLYDIEPFIRVFFFFFQAEDGIRDTSVTGVQTCALPICTRIPTTGSSSCCRARGGRAPARSSIRRTRSRCRQAASSPTSAGRFTTTAPRTKRPCSRSTGWGRRRRRTSTPGTEHARSDLALPRRVGLLAPPRTDRVEFAARQRSGGAQRRVLLPSPRLRRPDDGGVNARHAQREAQGDPGRARRRVAHERIVEVTQALPVVRVIW